jgi:quercetin dioxygenase-like cupin family protein
MMMVEVTFLKGAVGAPHRHIHEQVSYIAAGGFEFTIEGEMHVVRQGDSVYIPSDAEHGCRALEDSVIVDIFTPQREDFL